MATTKKKVDTTNTTTTTGSSSSRNIIRTHGRRSETALRPLQCELSSLHNCDGSAQWSSGHTTVLAAVHGPVASRQIQHEQAHAAAISVVLKSGTTHVGILEREWELFIAQQLSACIVTKQYPRCVISIVLQIVNADGSVLAALFQASIMALMDASIELLHVPVAVTCCIPPESNAMSLLLSSSIRLDPSHDEELAAQAVLTFVLSHSKVVVTVGKDNNNNNDNDENTSLLGCHTSAGMQISSTQTLNCWTICSKAVPAIQSFVRLVIEQKVTRESQTLWSN